MTKDEKRDALTVERDTVLHDHDREGAGEKGREEELTRLDGSIRAMCSHDSIHWDSRSTDDGRIITTCERCEASWYEHAG